MKSDKPVRSSDLWFLKEDHSWGDFPGEPMIKTILLMQRILVQSLVRELRSHMLKGVAKKKKKKEVILLDSQVQRTS